MKNQLQITVEESAIVPVRNLDDLRKLKSKMKVNVEFRGACPDYLLPYDGKTVEMIVEENNRGLIRFMKQVGDKIESWGTHEEVVSFDESEQIFLYTQHSTKKVYDSSSRDYQDKLKLLNS